MNIGNGNIQSVATLGDAMEGLRKKRLKNAGIDLTINAMGRNFNKDE